MVQAVNAVGIPMMLYNIPGRCGGGGTTYTYAYMYTFIHRHVNIQTYMSHTYEYTYIACVRVDTYMCIHIVYACVWICRHVYI